MVSAVLVEEVTRLPRRSSLSIQVSEVWLGGRDSNPDTVVQSHVSYRWTTSQYLSG